MESSAGLYQLLGLTGDGSIGDSLKGLDEKDARVRLQALLSDWLRMENLVVLTGSGTSVSSGGKTMANLEKNVLETLRALDGAPASAVAIVDSRIADVASATSSSPAVGFETWLSLVSNALVVSQAAGAPFSGLTWSTGTAPSTTDLEWLIARLRAAIFAECALVLSESAAPHLPFLAKLVARDSNLGRAHLFTLNYDTLFEQALELLGIQYSDGFSGRADARFDPSTYGLDIYYPGEVAEGRVRRFDKFMHLYKLHGSIHWIERNGEMRARHPDLQTMKGYGALSAEDKATSLTELAASIPSVGILPTANKFSQTLSMPYAHLFRAFQVRLAIPQTFLLVMGYGFGDDHVTQIIEGALMNPSLVLLVVEPNPNSAVVARIERYRELGKRAFLLTASQDSFAVAPFKVANFDDFATSIMPDVQWLEDFLKLRKFEKQVAQSAMPTGDDDDE
jgi:hypothetical protein